LVENGLRATLGYQGLTGLAYVELDIVSNPEQYPALDVAWELPEYYIPSYPSTIAQVSESMQSVMTIAREIEDVPFSDIGRSVDELLTQLNNLESDEQIARAADRAIKLLEDSGQVVSHIRSMLEAEGVQQMPQNAADAVARARKLMELAGRDVPALLEDARRAGKLLGQAAARADKLLADRRIDAGLEDAAGAAADLREAAEELPETVEQVRTTLQDAAELVARQEDEVQALLRELQSISRNLNRLSEDLNRNPSRLLFGEPPPRWEDIEE
jgi:paraquat-inducible protein B